MPEADPRTQGAFDMAAKQALGTLTSDKAAAMIAQDAKARGPDVAILDALKLVTQQVQQAASGAGVELPPEVLEAVQQAIAQVLVSMMVASGLAKDGDALMQTVAQALESGPGEPDADEGMDAPSGVLAQAQQGAM